MIMMKAVVESFLQPNMVLFVCVHNAGRSQMAEAIFNASAKKRGLDLRAASAGTVGDRASIRWLGMQRVKLGFLWKASDPRCLHKNWSTHHES